MRLPAVLAATLCLTTVHAWIPRNLTSSDTINLVAGVMDGIIKEDRINYL